jgi:hypothetical protein
MAVPFGPFHWELFSSTIASFRLIGVSESLLGLSLLGNRKSLPFFSLETPRGVSHFFDFACCLDTSLNLPTNLSCPGGD